MTVEAHAVSERIINDDIVLFASLKFAYAQIRLFPAEQVIAFGIAEPTAEVIGRI